MLSSNKNCLVEAGAVVTCAALFLCLGVPFLSGSDVTSNIRDDAQLRAMRDELERTKTLQLNNLDKPYFVAYSSDDTDQLAVSGSLGGITGVSRVRVRHPVVEIRVGSYALDNTNTTFSGTPPLGLLPLDDDYQAIRTTLWLTSDALYKAATDQLTRKRTALRELSAGDEAADLAPAKAVQLVLPIGKLTVDQGQWEDSIRRLSGSLRKHPDVISSSVGLLAVASTYRVVNSEGTVVRIPQDLAQVEIRANGIAADGAPVWNHDFSMAPNAAELPAEQEIARAVEAVATETEALRKAPLADEYSGPVLFEGEAAPEMMAEVMTDAARLLRKPLSPPGSNERGFLDSVWASRVGTKVGPEWLTIVDDPLQKSFQGHSLLGQYQVDDQGVKAAKVVLVDKGILKGFLLSREPVKGYSGSNGHGRLPGAYGSEAAVIGNMFVLAAQSVPEARMKAKLLERAGAAGLKYGVMIRRLDFPSTANLEELQSLVRQLQKNGYARTLMAPLLAYRVYPGGREELVRGFRFKEFSAKDLRDVAIASDHSYVLNYLNNGTAFNVAGLSQEATTSAVICPSLLFENIELDRAQEEGSRPPIVSPPALSAEMK
jgi:TldD protein